MCVQSINPMWVLLLGVYSIFMICSSAPTTEQRKFWFFFCFFLCVKVLGYIGIGTYGCGLNGELVYIKMCILFEMLHIDTYVYIEYVIFSVYRIFCGVYIRVVLNFEIEIF